MSQGTSDSSSGSRGELPSQAGVGHSQTAKRRGRCWAGAGQESHQAAPAAAAAQCGKEGPSVPDAWQAVAEVQQERLVHRDGDVSCVHGSNDTSCPLCCSWLAQKGFRVLSLMRHRFPFTPTQIMAFCHVSHWLWVISTLQCMTPFWDTRHCTVQPPFIHSPGASWGNAAIHLSVMGW